MNVLARIFRNLRDMRALGFFVIFRHLGRWRPGGRTKVAIAGVGDLHLRAGDSDFSAIRQIFVERDYDFSMVPALEARIMERYREILASGKAPVISDIGANIGAASLWFSMKFPRARIIAVEPDPGNFSILWQNISGKPEIVALEAAIGARAGFVTLHGEGQGWAVQTRRSESGVRIVTMEDVWAASPGDTPFIVKIDIEGFEADLFDGNVDWIGRPYAIIIEPHDWMLPGKLSSRAFQKAMAMHDFELFLRGENIIYARV